jgi:acyl-CoA reductase-like NAD-dependent aldehyde dehydrogenase
MSGTNGTSIDFEKFYNVINGANRGSETAHHGINPSNGKPLWDVPIGTAHDLDDAVVAAQKAYKTWSKTTWEERQEILKNIADEVGKYEEGLAKIVMLEGGKPVCFMCIPWKI